MMTALVSVDLPVFRAKRQDRKLAEKQAMAAAAKYEQEDKRRDVESMYQTARAEYDAETIRSAILAEQLLSSMPPEELRRWLFAARLMSAPW